MRQISTGLQDFKDMRGDGTCYVDKSMLIGQILDTDRRGIHLHTRPRRFGKSVNLSMIDAFFNLKYKGNTWFDGLEISKHSKYDQYKNAFPVITIDFKGLNTERGKFVPSVRESIVSAYAPFGYLLESDKVEGWRKSDYSRIINSGAEEEKLERSLQRLSEMLHMHHGVPAVILIDEYDAPMHKSYGTETQGEVLGFMRNHLSLALKGNSSMQMAVLTGITQIAKESIFSGLNNLEVNNILSEESDEMYGFTEAEVKALCAEYGHPEKFDEAREWYDGYRFGNAEIYNPWSVLRYVKKGFKPAPYWVKTSENEIIGDLIDRASLGTIEALKSLVTGGSILAGVNPQVTYADLKRDAGSIFSLMAVSGYLKAVPEGGGYGQPVSEAPQYRLSLPNAELYRVFADMLPRHLGGEGLVDALKALARAIPTGDAETVGESIGTLLVSVMSSRALVSEQVYQAFVAGALMYVSGRYDIKVDYEGGDGYYDLRLESLDGAGPNAIIEFKRLKPAEGKGPEEMPADAMRQAAESALAQIKGKRYAQGLEGRTIAYGAAFCGKRTCVVSEWL